MIVSLPSYKIIIYFTVASEPNQPAQSEKIEPQKQLDEETEPPKQLANEPMETDEQKGYYLLQYQQNISIYYSLLQMNKNLSFPKSIKYPVDIYF